MGIITTLIGLNERKKQADWDKHYGVLSQLASNPNLSDDAKQVVWGNIASLAGDKLGIPKQAHGPLAAILHGFSNLNPVPHDSYADNLQPLPPTTAAVPDQPASPDAPVPGSTLPGAAASSPFLTNAQVAARGDRIKAASAQSAFNQQQSEVDVQQARLDKLFDDKTDPFYKQMSAELQTGLKAQRSLAADNLQPATITVTDDDGTTKDITGFYDPRRGQYLNADHTVIDPKKLGASPKLIGKSGGAAGKETVAEKDRKLALAAYSMKIGVPATNLTPVQQVEAIHLFRSQTTGSQYGTLTPEGAEDIANQVVAGKFPPDLKGLYRPGPVMAALAKKGYDLTQARSDWEAWTKHVASLNGAAQLRLAQAVDFNIESLDLLEEKNREASKFVDRSRFPVWNKAAMQWALSGAGGQAAQNAASDLQIQIKDLQSEIAVVYKGGNSPTDVGLKTAADIFNSDWDESRLSSAIKLARRNLGYRLNSMRNVGAAGMSRGSQYNRLAPGGGSASSAPASSAPTVPAPASKGSTAKSVADDYLNRKAGMNAPK